MKRRIWTVAVGTRGARGAHRGTCRAGRIHLDEAGDHANGDRQSSSRRHSDPNDDPTAAVRDLRAGRDAADDEPGAWHTSSGPRTRGRQGTRPRRSRPSARGAARRRRPGPGLRSDTGGMPPGRARRSQRGSWCSTAAGQTRSQFPTYLVATTGTHCRARPGIHRRSACLRPTSRRDARVARRSARSCTAPSSPINGRLQPGPTRRVDRHLDAVHARHGQAERRRHRRNAGRDRTGRGEPRREALRAGARRHRRRDAGGPGSRRRDRHDLRWPQGDRAQAARPRVRSRRTARFAFKAKTGTFFRADADRSRRRRSAAVRAALSRCSAPIPCVNPTVNGFAAKSKVVKQEVERPRRSRRGPARPRPPTLRPMPATVRLGTCSFADEGLVKTWYPRGVSTSKARLATTPSASTPSRSTRPTTTCPIPT